MLRSWCIGKYLTDAGFDANGRYWRTTTSSTGNTESRVGQLGRPGDVFLCIELGKPFQQPGANPVKRVAAQGQPQRRGRALDAIYHRLHHLERIAFQRERTGFYCAPDIA